MNKRIALAAAVTATGLLAVPSFASAATSCIPAWPSAR